MKKPMAADRTRPLFAPEHVSELPQIAPELLDGPTLRVVRWPLLSERPCLVRCDHGERSLVRIRALVSLCGRSCADAIASSSQPSSEGFCQMCVARAGNGVLR